MPVSLRHDLNLGLNRLKATLHLMFGYEEVIRRAASLGRPLDEVIARRPKIIFLDEVLKPSDTAAQTLPFLRRASL
jgi:hypothetical protein